MPKDNSGATLECTSLVKLDVAAQAFRWSKPLEGKLVPLDEPPTLELPLQQSKRHSE